LIQLVQAGRAHGILPFHLNPTPSDLAEVLRRPPVELSMEVVDYVRWRGLGIDRDTAHIVRRIVTLSRELRSISAVSRSMYVSRRALGRRLTSRGLPVPSHWLQLGRLLRLALRLQNSAATLSSIAFEFGYSDGFSASNQMERLLGYRPSEVRERWGWEWILEAWLRQEADAGGLRPSSPVFFRSSRQPHPTDGRYLRAQRERPAPVDDR
jgi:AraC-like DNA-binding protein